MAFLVKPSLPPCVIYEDEDLLVVQKPGGWNTHAPAAYAGLGIHEWLKHFCPEWNGLAIVHRLDKETSGVMVFGKSKRANQSLTRQFATRKVKKTYLLVTAANVSRDRFTVRSHLIREGERFRSAKPGGASRSLGKRGPTEAVTEFRVIQREADRTLLEAFPKTGRTHQIRVHAAESGFPILGDETYGGAPHHRLHLHSATLEFFHPSDGSCCRFSVAPEFDQDPTQQLRRALFDGEETTCWRCLNGVADGFPGLYVDRLGEWLYVQSARLLGSTEVEWLKGWMVEWGLRGVYHKRLIRHVRGAATKEVSPVLVVGDAAPDEFEIRENGVRFAMRLGEGYSVGLFPDQRDNRRRFLTGHVGSGFPDLRMDTELKVLNAFAYTCGFSVCAALSGAKVTSLDLSRKYLDWGRRNFELNQLDPGDHDFIHGDVFGWMRRLAKKGRTFDAIILDPPTFSKSKGSGVFRVEKDYPRLMRLSLELLNRRGTILACCNALRLDPEKFCREVEKGVAAAGGRVEHRLFIPQPPDFPMSRQEPGHLKTLWLDVSPSA